MKSKMAALAAGLLAAGLIGTMHYAAAQQKGAAPLSLAMVDAQQLVQNSEAAKSIRTQLEKVRTDYQAAVKTEQEDLQKLDQSVAAQRGTLSADDYQKKVQEVRQKAQDLQRDVQQRQAKLGTAERTALQKVETTITEIVNDLRKEKKYTMVMSRIAFIGTTDIPDVTQDVMKRLNEKLPSVTVEIPQ